MNLKLHKKADDTSETEAIMISNSQEFDSSLRAQHLRIATLESKLRAKEAQLSAAVNPKKKHCSDAAIQADYLAVTECKESVYITLQEFILM